MSANPEFEIRASVPEDLSAFTRLIQASMQDAYANPSLNIGPELFDMRYFTDEATQEALRQQLTPSQRRRAWVALHTGDLVAALTTSNEGDHIEIVKLHTDKPWRGRGLGSRLMQEALNWWGENQRFELDVLRYNMPAILFYRDRFGFELDQSVPPKRYDHIPIEEWPAGHHPDFYTLRMTRGLKVQ